MPYGHGVKNQKQKLICAFELAANEVQNLESKQERD